MKKQLYTVLVLTLVLTSLTAAQPPVDVTRLQYPKLHDLVIPVIARDTLSNGLRVYLVEDHELPLYRMSVRINCGSFLEPAEKLGLVSMLGQVLRTGGTSTRTGDALDELLEGIGGSVETYGGVTSCGASVQVLSEHQSVGLEVLADILRHPVFDPDKLELARVAQHSAIARRNDQPAQIAGREFSKLIFGPESPYARQTESATIDAITRDDLMAFHQTYFHPENVQIAVWGDFDSKAVMDRIHELFGDWKPGSSPVPKPPTIEYRYEPGVYLIDRPDVNQSQVLIGHIGGLITDPDYADRIVMNNIMGVGFGSRMVDIVRSREGLAYSTSSAYSAGLDHSGVFSSYAATKSRSTAKAIVEMTKVIRSMQTEPPTEKELTQGKNSYLNSYVFQFDTRSEIVNRIMEYDFFGLPDDFLQQVMKRVEKVTVADIAKAAEHNLHPDALKVLVVGNSKDFDQTLDSLGLGSVTRIEITAPSSGSKSGLKTPSTTP
jgi:zinc protease